MVTRTPGYIDGRRFRVGNVPTWGPVPDVLIPGAMEAYGIFEDFLSCETLAGDGTTVTGEGVWQFKEANDCTIAQGDEAGGVMTLVNGALLNDGGQIMMGMDPAVHVSRGAFFLAAGKHLWFEARLKSTNAGTDNIGIFAGLVEPEDTDILANGGGAIAIQDHLGFSIRGTQTTYRFNGGKAAVPDENDLSISLDTSYHRFGFYVNGVTSVAVYLDRTLISAGEVLTASIPVVGLVPILAVKNNSANAETLTVDYIMCVQLR